MMLVMRYSTVFLGVFCHLEIVCKHLIIEEEYTNRQNMMQRMQIIDEFVHQSQYCFTVQAAERNYCSIKYSRSAKFDAILINLITLF